MPPSAAVYFATRKCLAGLLSRGSSSPALSVPQEEDEEPELQFHRLCKLLSSGKVSHCSQVPCPPGCSFGDGQCWSCLRISQHFSHHRATCKVQKPAPLLQLSFHPSIFCTAHMAVVAQTQKARAQLKTETQRNSMFGV